MNKNFETYVYSIIEKYQPRLLMTAYTFVLEYGLEKASSTMECKFNYPYLNITIMYGTRVVEKWEKGEDIVPFVVHEMCHPLTDPLYAKAISRHVSEDEIRDERERLTDYICYLILKNEKQ